MRLLFPELPPELRNAIYAETFDHSAPASSNGLPFVSKAYELAHTSLRITPIHRGNISLLQLQKYKFLEAREYFTQLVANNAELHITIVFKGHVNTFVQEHWNDKVTTHFKKIIKKFPWLSKVKRWDVDVFWKPPARTYGQGKPAVLARIMNGMVGTVLSFQDSSVRSRSGESRVVLHIDKMLACALWHQRLDLGLHCFLTTSVAVKREVREVCLDVEPESSRAAVGAGMVATADSEGGLVAEEVMVTRRILEDGESRWQVPERVAAKGGRWLPDAVWVKLVDHCGASGEISIVKL
ncbi:hypothetical protein BU24DRAFT_87216 [Aaosphaeria arxii CBS 175.79]|uniref:Uncharacterized protein n=1 Tax=Aaosphaeria arxii CBS 175.79 TaxID=1450172 RepID=A0A6A5X8S8_9PLEO|nr:uncharacterized protein BU24DRAFT_87216 [Aaosphaeria arxii CBS 175.79]KAF2009321.1 hypothetical protein BU24DRAFT_87216 [Aaosphaeria arxii CBS 175.79]